MVQDVLTGRTFGNVFIISQTYSGVTRIKQIYLTILFRRTRLPSSKVVEYQLEFFNQHKYFIMIENTNTPIDREVYKEILQRHKTYSKRVDRLSNFVVAGGIISI